MQKAPCLVPLVLLVCWLLTIKTTGARTWTNTTTTTSRRRRTQATLSQPQQSPQDHRRTTLRTPRERCACQPAGWEFTFDFSHTTCTDTNIVGVAPPGEGQYGHYKQPPPRGSFQHVLCKSNPASSYESVDSLDEELEHIVQIDIREYKDAQLKQVYVLDPPLTILGPLYNGQAFQYHSVVLDMPLEECDVALSTSKPSHCELPSALTIHFTGLTQMNNRKDFEITWIFAHECSVLPIVYPGDFIGPLTVVRVFRKEYHALKERVMVFSWPFVESNDSLTPTFWCLFLVCVCVRIFVVYLLPFRVCLLCLVCVSWCVYRAAGRDRRESNNHPKNFAVRFVDHHLLEKKGQIEREKERDLEREREPLSETTNAPCVQIRLGSFLLRLWCGWRCLSQKRLGVAGSWGNDSNNSSNPLHDSTVCFRGTPCYYYYFRPLLLF